MGRSVDLDDLIDVGEVAALLGLAHKNSVTTYMRRYEDFPAPALEFAEVGRAFNGRVTTELQAEIDALAPGQTIDYAGTFSLNSASDKILLTPVLLGPAGGAQ